MRGGQREKVAISNRMPRFRIRACSALVRFEIERSGISFLLPLLFEEGLPFFIPSRSRVLCRGKEFFPKFQEGSILQLKTFPGEITGFSRRTAESAFFKSRTQRDHGSVNWASYGILLLESGSGLILADSYGLSSRCSVMLKSKPETPLSIPVQERSSMVKTSSGMFAGRKLCKRRQSFRWAYAPYKRRMLGLDYKADPLEGS